MQEACRLVRPWADEARIELRSLRPAVRRRLLVWLGGRTELAIVVAARRTLVVAPARDAERVPGAGRRKVLLLTARDGEHCVWCSKVLTYRSADATVDHVRCRSHGGASALDNLVLSCAACNHRRANATADVWLARCLAAGAPVDVEAVTAAIRRSADHHRRRPLLEPAWRQAAAA